MVCTGSIFLMRYAHLHTLTNFTFLTGASHPGEYIYEANDLGYDAIAITDECSLAGVVKAFIAIEELKKKERPYNKAHYRQSIHLIQRNEINRHCTLTYCICRAVRLYHPGKTSR